MRHSKLIIIFTVAFVTLCLMLLDQMHPVFDTTPENAQVTPGQPAPDVAFNLLDGGTVSLRSLSGHTIWLHFWASWCALCRQEFGGLLKRLQREKDNTILLAVSGDANAEDVRRFLSSFKHDFGPLFESGRVITARDPDHKLIEGTFQTFQYPETIIITPDLIMRRKIVGKFGNGQ